MRGTKYLACSSFFISLIQFFGLVECHSLVENCGEASQITEGGAFDRVVVVGRGFHEAEIRARTCFFIQALDTFGRPMDTKCGQKTFFAVNLRCRQVFLTADMTYLQDTGLHKACYTVGLPGTYSIEIYLVFSNYNILTSAAEDGLSTLRNLVQKRPTGARVPHVEGFERMKLVATSSVKVTLPSAGPVLTRPLPRCSLRLLRLSQNRGFWNGPLWSPLACQPFRMTPQDIVACMKGKRVLLIGDSQVRYHLAELMSYLNHRSRCIYLKRRWKRRVISNIMAHNKLRMKQAVLWDPVRDGVPMAVSKYGTGGYVHFYGNFWNGFARARARAHVKGAQEAFNITYVSHLLANQSSFQPWMVNSTLLGPSTADQEAPFDFVLASAGLHDLSRFYSAESYAAALEAHFLPSLVQLVRDPSRIAWLGMWAAHERSKPDKHIPISNNPRGFRFEEAARRSLRRFNITNWIHVRGMTGARPDLCMDSTHYAWPVPLATLELWLGSLCRDFQSPTNTTCAHPTESDF